MVGLAEFERHLVQRLDGQHDRPQFVEALAELVAQGELSVQQDGEPIADPSRVRQVLRETVEQRLSQFARNALLVVHA